MKINSLFIFFFVCACVFKVQAQSNTDIWSGSYVIYSVKDSTRALDTLVINKSKDLLAEDVPWREEFDLKRWTIASVKDKEKESKMIRRFLFNPEEKVDEYKEFGWTALHQSGKMNCIDGGHFFICQTEPETTINFPKEEKFYSKTGIIGIWLHSGLVELKKIK